MDSTVDDSKEAKDMEQLKIINEELDNLIIRNFVLLQDYCSTALEMENILSNGFLQITKSKMFAKPNTISPTYFSSETVDEEALFTVGTDSILSSNCKLMCSVSDDTKRNEHLKKLKQKIAGFLPPHSLGLAQDMFLSAIGRAIQRCTIQREILQCNQKFQELSVLKNELLKNSESEQ